MRGPRITIYAVSISLATAPAQAQWAVFDAGNFTKNTVTALQTAQQYAQMVLGYALQVQQYVNMLQNTKALAIGLIGGAVARELKSAGVDMNDAKQVVSESVKLYNVYNQTSQVLKNSTATFERAGKFSGQMNLMSLNSGLSWSQILAEDKARAQAGQKMSAGLYQQATEIQQSLADNQARADEALKTAGNAEGAVQALQAMSVQNHLLSDQMSTLVTMAASNQRRQAVFDQRDFQDQEKLKSEAEKNMRGGADALSRFKGLSR